MIIVNKLTIEICQEADNSIGSEHAEIIVNPSLISLFDSNGKSTHYYTFKSEGGFSFDDKEEILNLFDKVEKIINQTK
jgi:hypothetical protein